MGKSKKAGKGNPPHRQANLSLEELESRALADLAEGRFRRARDAFKQLAKEDRPRFLPRLIEANSALAADMTAKGQTSEAEQVIAYLRTIAPPETVAALQIPLQLAGEKWDLAAKSAAAALDAGLADGATGAVRFSDALMLAGVEPPPPSGESDPLPWRDDFAAIARAARAHLALATGKPAQAVQLAKSSCRLQNNDPAAQLARAIRPPPSTSSE